MHHACISVGRDIDIDIERDIDRESAASRCARAHLQPVPKSQYGTVVQAPGRTVPCLARSTSRSTVARLIPTTGTMYRSRE